MAQTCRLNFYIGNYVLTSLSTQRAIRQFSACGAPDLANPFPNPSLQPCGRPLTRIGKKSAAGDVTISPDASGGTTTCTCPDPQNPSRDNFRCAVENYVVPTQMTLTATPTVGQFNKWDKACKGQPDICVLTLDPVAAKPDKKTKAIFKP